MDLMAAVSPSKTASCYEIRMYSKNSTLCTAGFYYGINQLCPRCKNLLTTTKGKSPQSNWAMKESHKQKPNDLKVKFKPEDTTENIV